MDVYAMILQELREGGCEFIDVYAPYYIACAGAHLFNLKNKRDHVYYEHRRVVDTRMHLCMVAPPGMCLSPNTAILMEDGSTKLLKEVKVGDRLASIDGRMNIVRDKRCTYPLKALHIEPHDFRCTKLHRVLTSNGWKYARDLKVGDYLITGYTIDQLQLFGFWLAEGRFEGKWWQPMLSNTDKKLLQLIDDLLRKTFDVHLVPAGPPAEYRCSSIGRRQPFNHFARFIQRFRIYKRGRATQSSNKCIPPELFTLPKVGLLALYQGFMVGDVHRSKQHHMWGISSEQLHNNLTHLLDKLQVKYTDYGKTYDHPTCSLYQARVSQFDRYKLEHTIERNEVVCGQVRIAEIREVYASRPDPYIDLDTTAEHFIANNIVVHNSKTFWIDQFLRGEQAIFHNSGIEVGFEGSMTEAGFVGTIKFLDGEPLVTPGAAKIYQNALLGIEEFAQLTELMRTEYSKTLDTALLSALDTGYVYKRLAAGSISYQTNVTLITGVQPARYDLSAGLGRRFFFLLFIPTANDLRKLKLSRRKAKGLRYNPMRLETIRREIRNIKFKVDQIQEVEWKESVYKLLDDLDIPHYEESLYERLMIGYHIMRDRFDRTLTISANDPELRALVVRARNFRNLIKKGAEFAEVLSLLKDNKGSLPIDVLKDKLAIFGLDWRQSSELINEMCRLRLIRIKNGIVRRWY
ncbi:MAG: hypothetical protein ACTSYJ_11455 [Candidatus Thorarchaeota archaeon]